MPLGSATTFDQIRADLARAHSSVFGSRADDALEGLIDSTSQALSLLSQASPEDLGACDAEPDFITGTSEQERTA
ncbi:MAG: hypothetical protein ACKVVP_09285 [Chloroflexota bacterium]